MVKIAVNTAGQDAGLTQALQICAMVKGRCLIHQKEGKLYKYFDVASLTKIMVTVPLMAILVEEKRVDLNRPISNYLPWLEFKSVGKIQVRELLRHKSGLEWWKPFYLKLNTVPPADRESILKEMFSSEKARSSKTCVYSDLDFILLGWLIEGVLDLSLEEAASTYLFKPLGLKHTFFNSSGVKLPGAGYFAPTEKTPLRGVIQSIVHDENAWALGGVAGHAGLFSTLEDAAKLGGIYLDLALEKKQSFVSPKVFKKFVKRAVPKNAGDWALGFSIPSRPFSTAGSLVSSEAFGHTGFTGTSLWVDVKREAVVVILSNRTYPTRKMKSLRR